MKSKKITLLLPFLFLTLFLQIFFISCGSIAENVKSQGDINYIIESVSGQLESFKSTGKGPIDSGTQNFVNLKLSDCTWNNYSKTLKVYINENFNLKAVFEFDTTRKIWLIKEEIVGDDYGNTQYKEDYISDVDFDRYGYLREYNFRMINITYVDSKKEDSPVTGHRTRVRVIFKRAE